MFLHWYKQSHCKKQFYVNRLCNVNKVMNVICKMYFFTMKLSINIYFYAQWKQVIFCYFIILLFLRLFALIIPITIYVYMLYMNVVFFHRIYSANTSIYLYIRWVSKIFKLYDRFQSNKISEPLLWFMIEGLWCLSFISLWPHNAL